MVDIDKALDAYTAACASADTGRTVAVKSAQGRADKAVAAAEASVRRAREVQEIAAQAAEDRHRVQVGQALADLDERLKQTTGAHPAAYLRSRAGGVVEVRVDEFGPAVASMGQAGGGWYVDLPTGREFCGGFGQARSKLWAAARPERS